MAGEQKRQKRQAWIAAALLLGYKISPWPWNDMGGYCARDSDNWIFRSRQGVTRFPSQWEAARAILLSLEINPNEVWQAGERATRRSAVPEIFERRNQQERIRRFAKGARSSRR